MGTAAVNMAWAVGVILIGGLYLLISFGSFWDDLSVKIKSHSNQDLATTCYVDGKFEEYRVNQPKIYAGYFFDGKGDKVNADIVEQRKDEVKVGWLEIIGYGQMGNPYYHSHEEWISTKDFHKYYTLEQVAEIINKTKKKGQK